MILPFGAAAFDKNGQKLLFYLIKKTHTHSHTCIHTPRSKTKLGKIERSHFIFHIIIYSDGFFSPCHIHFTHKLLDTFNRLQLYEIYLLRHIQQKKSIHITKWKKNTLELNCYACSFLTNQTNIHFRIEFKQLLLLLLLPPKTAFSLFSQRNKTKLKTVRIFLFFLLCKIKYSMGKYSILLSFAIKVCAHETCCINH